MATARNLKTKRNASIVKGKKAAYLTKLSPVNESLIENLKKAKDNSSEVLSALLKQGHWTESQLAEYFGREYNIEVIENLNDYDIKTEVLGLIPQQICEKHTLIPLTKISQNLVVVFENPSDINLRDNLSLITGHKILPVTSTRTAIKTAFKKYFSQSEILKNLSYDSSFETAGFEFDEAESGFNLDEERNKKTDDPVISFVNLMFMDAIELNSSDIHIESYEKRFRIRYRIDGDLNEKHSLSKEMIDSVVSRIKVMSGMDISEKRKPQDARLKVQLYGKYLNMRVNCTPTVNGEKIVLRILDDSCLQEDMSRLGMEPFQLEMFEKALFAPQGMILLTGPTGSGKTTTIYSGLMKLNTSQRNISTAEDPVEFKIYGINQVQMNPRAGMTFSTALRAFLRQDPDVILVGEIRDLETAEIAFKASATGHMVLSTVHTNDTASTVNRLVTMGVPFYNVADNTSLIISQRLLKKLCPQCRVQEEGTLYLGKLKALGVDPKEINSYKGKIFKRNPDGCNECNNIGNKGRIAIYEMMRISQNVKLGILENLNPIELKKIAIEKDNLLSLRYSALLKARQGLVSIEEVIRTTVFD